MDKVRLRYFINNTCGCGYEKCYYDANKYYDPNGIIVTDWDSYDFNADNELELDFAFGHELKIEPYF